jgi:hypothetical protein
MKIYAARNVHGFDRYVGKDLWVLCHTTKYLGDWHADVYTKFLGRLGDGRYLVRRISKSDARELGYGDLNSIRTKLSWTENVAADDMQILEPVEMYTTSELIQLGGGKDYDNPYADVIEFFKQFAGTDLWVRARQWNGFSDRYFHIISMDDTSMVVNAIGTGIVDNGRDSSEFSAYGDASILDWLQQEHVVDIFAWHAVENSKVYTTEELYKKLGLEKYL